MLKHFQIGLTLLEALIAVAILAILLTLGLPAMGQLLRQNQLNSALLQAKGTLQFARGRALATEAAIGVCSGGIWLQCDPDLADPQAWTVFVDRNGDRRLDAQDEIIQQRQWTSAALSVLSSRTQPMFFTAQGAAGSNTSLTFCVRGEHEGRKLILANSGRVRAVKIDCPATSDA